MIYIKKSKAGYRVVYISGNNEVLAVSEVLKSPQSAWKNIKAMMSRIVSDSFLEVRTVTTVSDYKGDTYRFYSDGEKKLMVTPKKKK